MSRTSRSATNLKKTQEARIKNLKETLKSVQKNTPSRTGRINYLKDQILKAEINRYGRMNRMPEEKYTVTSKPKHNVGDKQTITDSRGKLKPTGKVWDGQKWVKGPLKRGQNLPPSAARKYEGPPSNRVGTDDHKINRTSAANQDTGSTVKETGATPQQTHGGAKVKSGLNRAMGELNKEFYPQGTANVSPNLAKSGTVVTGRGPEIFGWRPLGDISTIPTRPDGSTLTYGDVLKGEFHGATPGQINRLERTGMHMKRGGAARQIALQRLRQGQQVPQQQADAFVNPADELAISTGLPTQGPQYINPNLITRSPLMQYRMSQMVQPTNLSILGTPMQTAQTSLMPTGAASGAAAMGKIGGALSGAGNFGGAGGLGVGDFGLGTTSVIA